MAIETKFTRSIRQSRGWELHSFLTNVVSHEGRNFTDL